MSKFHGIPAIFVAILLFSPALSQESIDPAFRPPVQTDRRDFGKIRWNGAAGVTVMKDKLYGHLGFRPDIVFAQWSGGIDMTFRFNDDGEFREREWDDGWDYFEKLYYFNYGMPGDPLFIHAGGLEKVTLGYGLIMRRYSNTVQYPETKKIGGYTEFEYNRLTMQGMFNSVREFEEPGLMGARAAYRTPLESLTLGGTLAHDGNQFAGLPDADAFPDDVGQFMYSDIKESVTIVGADAGFPLVRAGRPVSIWSYTHIAKIMDFGFGWGFPGLRTVTGPFEMSAEFRHYEKQFVGEFFDFSYELQRTRLAHDTLFASKESQLYGLGVANGYYLDFLFTPSDLGYLFLSYTDLRGLNYPFHNTVYAEISVSSTGISGLSNIMAYIYQPNTGELFEKNTNGLIYGGKIFLSFGKILNFVYDHRVTYYVENLHHTARAEAMITF